MFVSKQFKIESAHFIKDHPKCGTLHGHTFLIKFMLEGEVNKDGMVIDFHDLGTIARELLHPLDHNVLNNVLSLTPLTAETLALYLAKCFAQIIFEDELCPYPNIHAVHISVQEGVDGGTAITGMQRKKEPKLETRKKRQTNTSKNPTPYKRHPRSTRKESKRR